MLDRSTRKDPAVLLFWDRTLHADLIPYLCQFVMLLSRQAVVSIITEEEGTATEVLRACGMNTYSVQQITGLSKSNLYHAVKCVGKFVQSCNYQYLHVFSQRGSSLSILLYRMLPVHKKIYYILPDPLQNSFTLNRLTGRSVHMKHLLTGSHATIITSSFDLYEKLNATETRHVQYFPAHLHAAPELSSKLNKNPHSSYEKKPTLAIASPLEKNYQIELGLNIMKCLSDLRDDMRFLIIGDGSQKIRFLMIADYLGLRERIIWINNRPDLHGLLNECDAVLCPPSPVIPVELEYAVSVGTPVFMPNIEGVQHLLHHPLAGSVYDNNEPAEIAAFIHQNWRELTSSHLRQQRREIFRQRFSPESYYSEWLQIYRNM